MSEEMEIQKRINELVEEKTRRELAERTPEEKEKDETFLAEFYTWQYATLDNYTVKPKSRKR
tara:strand:+ start:870 stop:1055 length:186 start_codon:yes stop_codon:yes gene_type:complete